MAKQFLIPKKRSLIERLRSGSKPRRFDVTDAHIDQWCKRIEARHPLFDISVPSIQPAVGANDVGEGASQALQPDATAVRVKRG